MLLMSGLYFWAPFLFNCVVMKIGNHNMLTPSMTKSNSIQFRSKLLTIFLLASLTFVSSRATEWGLGDAKKVADSLANGFRVSENESIELNPSAGLGDYLRYAALNSPSLKAAFHDWKAALEKTGYAGAMPDPMLSYGYFIENVETRVGPQEHRLSLKQAYPWFGTLGARKDIAWEAANAVLGKYQSEKLRLFYQVKAIYYNLYYLGREIALTRENMELLFFWESVVRTKYKVALRQHPDVIKVQVELGKLEDRLASLEAMVEPVAARLRAVLNIDENIVIGLPEEIVINEQAINHDSLLARVVADNPDLIVLGHLIDKERAGVSLAQKENWPNFTFGVDYIRTGEAINPLLAESGKDPWMVSVGINLPIWLGKNKSKKQEAQARYRSAEYRHIDAKNRAIAVTEKVLFEYDDAMRKISLYRDGLLPKAEQSLNANYTAYQAGEADFLSILDAQRLLLDFELKLEKAMVDLATKRAELEMITGHEIETDGNKE